MFGRFRNRRLFRRMAHRILKSSDSRSQNRTNQPFAGAQNPEDAPSKGGSAIETGQVKPEQAGQPSFTLRLPADCPRCGAPVRSDEVEWIDVGSIVCSYCGGVILTT
jgi:hypothetical protein